MSVLLSCPRCHQPMAIPDASPELVRCSRCGAVQQRTPAAAETAVAGPSAQANPQRQVLIFLGLLGGVLLLSIATIAGITWALLEKKPGEEAVAQNIAPPNTNDASPSLPAPNPPAESLENKAPPDEIKLPAPSKPVPPKAKLPAPPQPAPALTPQIQAAIDRGVAHLKNRVLAGKNFSPLLDPLDGATGVQIGAEALAGLTLLETGVSPRDEAVRKVLADVRRHGRGVTHIYSMGTMLFFLNRIAQLAQADALTDEDRRFQRGLALQLVAGQCENGRWTYWNPPLTNTEESKLLQQLEARTFRPVRPARTGLGPSNSMTQFALLALWGSRQQVPVRQPILHAAARFHSTQSARGTWSYGRPDAPAFFEDSNTCAGLLALAMEKSLREDKEFRGLSGAADPSANPRADEQCAKAFAHLGKVIGRTRDDPTTNKSFGTIFKADAVGDYYFLWCLERVAVIYSRETIGGKDWYAWGSEVILQNQKQDGSWQDIHGDVPDTCFALLFLTRANLAKDLTESIRLRGLN